MSRKRIANRFDTHRLSEFIYGTVIALVAVSGLENRQMDRWFSSALIVIAGGAVIWLAHTYSTLMSHWITGDHDITTADVARAFRDSWPIVTASMVVALPFMGVALSLYAMDIAFSLASAVGIAIFALIGVAAGRVTEMSWPKRVLLVLLSSGLGLLIVAIEVAVHH